MFDYDAELRRHNDIFRAATGVRPGDRVLDVGCGAGQSTREAAGAAVDGSAHGVDVSAEMLDDARRITEDAGLHNVSYEQADAQVHRFPPAHFDVCISRFGTMFFADLVAAFTNIGLAVRPAGRLVMLVWQGRDRNEWSYVVRQAITGSAAPPAATRTPAPDAFSLADPEVTEDILTTAGFTEVTFTDVHEPVYYGPDRKAAFDAVLSLSVPGNLLADLADGPAEQARDRLRTLLADHETDDGVYFDSRAWIVTARRR